MDGCACNGGGGEGVESVLAPQLCSFDEGQLVFRVLSAGKVIAGELVVRGNKNVPSLLARPRIVQPYLANIATTATTRDGKKAADVIGGVSRPRPT